MNRKLLTVFLILSVLALMTSTTLNHSVEAKSKSTLKTVDNFLKKNTVGGNKLRDLCQVNIITDYGKKNASLTIRECKTVTPPPNDNQSNPNDNQTNPNNNQTNPNNNQTNPNQDCQTNEIWNGTSCVPQPQPPTCNNGQFYNTTSQQCEQLPVPEPEPTPTNASAKIIGVGDIECSGDGIKVLDQVKKENPNLVINLGDLCYDSTTSNYLSTWGTLGNLVACVVGNHDSAEDGSASLEKAFVKYCGNDYSIKNGNYLVIGLNTNGADLTGQAQRAVTKISNSSFMNGIKVVIVASHKGICEIPPNQHHTLNEDANAKAVVSAFCQPILNAVPHNTTLIFLSAHNHVMSFGEKGNVKFVQSGAGGAGHYTCGTDSTFKLCNNTKYGFYEIEIDSNGKIKAGFKDINGGAVQ